MKRQGSDPDQTTAQAEPTSDRIYRQVSDEEIAARAYEIYQSRGGGDGADLDDWLQAERELSEQPSVVYGIARGAA